MMKKQVISTILSAILVVMQTGVMAKDYTDYPQKFWDVPKEHWAFENISEMVDKGIVNGYEDGSFRPDNTVTRAEWAKIMVIASGFPITDNSVHYIDMQNHWANKYVNTAKEYLSAYADGTFKPNQTAVREDVAVSIVKLKGYDIRDVDYSYLNQFKDVHTISNSLKMYVAVAVKNHLISGFEDGTFRGQDTLTRAEAATLLWRAFQAGNNDKVVNTSISAAIQPPEEEKPVEAPRPIETPKPTQKPEEEKEKPAETQKPEPEPGSKPYKIDTLVKLEDGFVDYEIGDEDSIYYTNGEKIIKVDIYEKEEEEILDSKDLTIDTDEYTLDDFKISNIYYDKYHHRLLLQGEYKTVNSANSMNNSYLYEINENDVIALTDKFPVNDSEPPAHLVGILSNGDYVTTTGAVIDCNNFGKKYSLRGNVQALEESSDNLYYYAYNIPYGDGARYEAAFCKYDFVHTSLILNNSNTSNPENRHFGLSNEYFITTDSDNSGSYIRFYNFKGKQLKEITNNDYVIKDKSTVIWNDWRTNIFAKLLLTSDRDIIFYDSSAKALRIISENA